VALRVKARCPFRIPVGGRPGPAPWDDGAMTLDVSEVSRDELISGLRARRITLVDVLSPESFAAMHIPGAINLPVVDLARRAAEVLPDRAAAVVTYCGGPT